MMRYRSNVGGSGGWTPQPGEYRRKDYSHKVGPNYGGRGSRRYRVDDLYAIEVLPMSRFSSGKVREWHWILKRSGRPVADGVAPTHKRAVARAKTTRTRLGDHGYDDPSALAMAPHLYLNNPRVPHEEGQAEEYCNDLTWDASCPEIWTSGHYAGVNSELRKKYRKNPKEIHFRSGNIVLLVKKLIRKGKWKWLLIRADGRRLANGIAPTRKAAVSAGKTTHSRLKLFFSRIGKDFMENPRPLDLRRRRRRVPVGVRRSYERAERDNEKAMKAMTKQERYEEYGPFGMNPRVGGAADYLNLHHHKQLRRRRRVPPGVRRSYERAERDNEKARKAMTKRERYEEYGPFGMNPRKQKFKRVRDAKPGDYFQIASRNIDGSWSIDPWATIYQMSSYQDDDSKVRAFVSGMSGTINYLHPDNFMQKRDSTPYKYNPRKHPKSLAELKWHHKENNLDEFELVDEGGLVWLIGYGEYPPHSVLAGQTKKSSITAFETMEEALRAYPYLEVTQSRSMPPAEPPMAPPPGFDYLDAGEYWSEEDY